MADLYVVIAHQATAYPSVVIQRASQTHQSRLVPPPLHITLIHPSTPHLYLHYAAPPPPQHNMSHPPHPTPHHTPATTPPPHPRTWAPTLPTLTALTTHTHPTTFLPTTHPTTLHALTLSAAATLRSASTQSELHQAAAIAVALEEVVAVHRVVRGWMAAREGDDGAVFAGGDEAACVVCLTALAEVLMLPCQHLVLCTACCAKMEEVGLGRQRSSYGSRRAGGGARDVTCPVCRGRVAEKVTVKRC
ncbi:uncharacterized protein H6S33_006998 [Morchella sextelata]|uniref:uncharacterized protein n=1 Tax=Morchella sextelata TaxID=1174677 RepID=UPI001D03B248|nr:uncharacterized protein H6S33_006998 [Morchella sextelata]KAH0603967.1 hypothetical protein H6S33_006998 [Morchella sextelata]